MSLRLTLSALALVLTGQRAAAEVELSFYSGLQTAPHSIVSVTDDPTLGDTEFSAKWNGRSFAMPPYYGLRGTWWRTDSFGWGLEFTHDKVYADDATRADNGFNRLEFTDGLNILTLNAVKRWPDRLGRLTPYAGAGLGIAVPHVDIEPAGGPHTWEYQLTGPAARWFAGVRYDLNDRWSLFGEYQGTYSMNTVALDDGGTLKTNIVTNALNIGVSFGF